MVSVGLALGGGSVRGAAHIGVVRTLEKAGVDVSCVAGTSSGAMVGGLAARKVDWEALLYRMLRTHWTELVDLSFNLEGPISGEKLLAWLKDFIGDPDIRECERPFAATAVDLKSGELVALTKGSLLQAIRASIALPGLFPPVELNNMLLADGGILSVIPVDVVRSLGADIVVAVDVSNDPPEFVHSRRGIRDRVRRIVRDELVSRSLKRADFVIRPEVGNVRPFDFGKLLYCIAAGQREAQRVLPELEALIRQREAKAAEGQRAETAVAASAN